MKHKWMGLLLCLVLLLSAGVVFAGGEGETPDDGKILIGLSMVQKDSDWWNTMGKFAKQACEAEGWETVTVWGGGDQQKQIKDIEDLIARGVDYIIMGPIQQEGSMVAIDKAYEAGIPVVTVGRRSNTSNQFGEVFANEAQFGIEQVEQLHKDYPDGANIVYLFGPVGAGYAIQMWEQGVVPTLEKYPNLKILERYSHPSDITSDGIKTAEDAIVRFGDQIDCFAASNDGLALGAVRAVQAAGLGDEILVYGAGLTLMGMEAVYDETMHYTTLKSQAQMATKAVEFLKMAIAGETPTKKQNLVEPVVIMKDNVLTVRDPMFGGTVPNPSTWTPPN
jgi:ABC-type sugar transport system substrate-binding protein